MKKLILLAAVAFSLTACMHDGYTIKGTITGDSESLKSGKAYLANAARDTTIRDTVDVVNGKFVFKGKVSTPEQYFIAIEGVKGRLGVFVENEAYVVTGVDSTLADSNVEGGFTHQLVTEFKARTKELVKKHNIDSLMAEYRTAGTTDERRLEISKLHKKFMDDIDSADVRIIKINPLSHYALQGLSRKVSDMDIPEAKEKVAAFKADIAFTGNRFIASIEEMITRMEKVQVGQIAPEFKHKDPNGKEIALSDIYKKNKITMIDFWAGWCGPCRAFNPKLVKIYKQFHKKGFEVLGVSFDRDRESWLKAIKDDKLTWPQISELKYWNTEVVKLYNVKGIPANVFVDQDGKIIAYNLPKDEIVDFLKKNL